MTTSEYCLFSLIEPHVVSLCEGNNYLIPNASEGAQVSELQDEQPVDVCGYGRKPLTAVACALDLVQLVLGILPSTREELRPMRKETKSI